MSAFNSTLTKALNVFITKVWSKLPPSGLNNYWNSEIEKDQNLRNAYITIDIVFGGNNRFFISTEPISVTDSKGNVYQYLPLLQEEPSINSEYSLGTAQPSQRSFSISFDGRLLEPMSVINNGDSLAGIAEISLQVDGGLCENRYIIMRGDMSGGITFGAKEEVVTTDIVDPSFTSDKLVPENFCTFETIPTIPDSYVGHRYPLIYDSYPFVPCIATSSTQYQPTFLVCDGTEHVVNKIYINGIETLSTDSDRGWNAYHSVDRLGNPVTIVRFINSTIAWESGDTVYADVSRRDKIERNLIEIIKNILISGSLLTEAGLDAVLFGRAEQKLSSYKVKCLINGSGTSDTARALEYVESTLCESFPMISLTFTGRGYGPIVTDRTNDYIALNLTARQGLLYDRVSDLQESSKSEIKNSFTIKYDFDSVNNNYKRIITRNASNSALCKISKEKFGEYEGDVLESIVIYDDSVATQVIDWMVAHYTLPSYDIEYSGAAALKLFLNLGDNIRLTDEKLSISNALGTVTRIEYQKGQVVIGIKLWLLYENIGSSISFGGAFGNIEFLTPEEEEQERVSWPGFEIFQDANGDGVDGAGDLSIRTWIGREPEEDTSLSGRTIYDSEGNPIGYRVD